MATYRLELRADCRAFVCGEASLMASSKVSLKLCFVFPTTCASRAKNI